MPEALKFTDTEKAAFRAAYSPAGATDEQWSLFINECQRRALVPGKDVIFQLRSAQEFDKDLNRKVYVKKVTFITTIGGLRLIAQRDGHYEGHGPFIYYYGTDDGALKESKIPLGKIPHAVSVEGFRKDWRVPLFATARYDAYVQKFGDDKKPTGMWATRGEEQLAKCCEAGMLRTVAPEECAGLLINEELGNDGIIDKEEINQVVTPVTVPLANQAPVVNQKNDATYETVNVVPLVPNVEPAIVALVAEQDKKREHEPVQSTAPVEEPTAIVQEPTGQVSIRTAIMPPMSATPQSITIAQPVPSGDAPATRKEYDDFLGRASKLVRDKLPKGGLKDQAASNGVKDYLLKLSGKTGVKQLSAATWERLLAPLEDAVAPEDAVAIVKAVIAK